MFVLCACLMSLPLTLTPPQKVGYVMKAKPCREVWYWCCSYRLLGQKVEDGDRAEGQAGPQAADQNLVGHPRHSVGAGQPLSIPTVPSLLTHPLPVSQHCVQDSTVHMCTAPFAGLEKHTSVAQETRYGKHRRRCDHGLPVDSV